MREAKMSRRFALIAAAILIFLTAPSAPAANPPDAPPVILIQNATILTVSHGAIEHGSILIKDGKIAEVGQSVKAPQNAQVIDAAGQYVIPASSIATRTSPSTAASTKAASPSLPS